MATIAKTQRSSDMPWLVVLGVLSLIGFGAWAIQLSAGLAVLGVGQEVAWGAYIAGFFLLAGAGSGLLVLAASADLGLLPALKAQSRTLLVGSIGAFVGAGMLILMDLGRPERVLAMVFSPNFKSMFVWDFYSLAVSVVLCLVYLYAGPRKLVAVLAGIAALAVVIVEGWILSVSAGSPLWQSSIVPVVFLLESLVVASALVLILAGDRRGLRGLMAGLLLALLVLAVMELVTVSYGGDPEAQAGMRLLTGGSLAYLYWGNLIIGIGLPAALLVGAGSSRVVVGLAGVLAILGVFAAKLALLVAGQAIPFLGERVSYVPSAVELAGVVGMIGLAGFLFVLGKRVISD